MEGPRKRKREENVEDFEDSANLPDSQLSDLDDAHGEQIRYWENAKQTLIDQIRDIMTPNPEFESKFKFKLSSYADLRPDYSTVQVNHLGLHIGGPPKGC